MIVKATITKYLPETHEFECVINGKKTKIDPFVGCVWEDDKRTLGTFVFEGDWGYQFSDGKSFLPSKELEKYVDGVSE